MSDEELVRQYGQSDDKALVGILYERYSHLVFGVCLKYLKNRDESRDAVINIFERLFTGLKQHNIENFKSWIHSVARNHCLMLLRKSNRPGTEKDIETLEHTLETENNEPVLLKEEQLNRLDSAILELNHEQKKCIELFYLQDKSYQEVADQTGLTLNQVKSCVQNGKRNLKILLTKQNEIEQ